MSDFSLTAILYLLDQDSSVVDGIQLRVDRITHTVGRNPVVFSIPGIGADTDGVPQIFTLDFGMMTENIILSGVLPDNDPLGADVPRFPNHQGLATVARTWWRYSAFATDFEALNGNFLELDEGPGHGRHRYKVVVQNLSCDRVGGETKWAYKITFAVTAFPESGSPLF